MKEQGVIYKHGARVCGYFAQLEQTKQRSFASRLLQLGLFLFVIVLKKIVYLPLEKGNYATYIGFFWKKRARSCSNRLLH